MSDKAMKRKTRLLVTWGVPVVALCAAIGMSLVTKNWLVLFALLAALPLPIRYFMRRWNGKSQESKPSSSPEPETVVDTSGRQISVGRTSLDLDDPDFLAQRMLDEGRYALLLRPQIAANLPAEQLRAAVAALDDSMGIVPEGDVLLQSWRNKAQEDSAAQRDRLVHVEAMYLDRYPVTNRQFQQFVDDGGYENMPLWDTTIWPAVLDFVDRTGHCGPRFWEEGHYPEGIDDHPVVGVSWYEAAAYARWSGKRLPSDPEWVKAGCWPVLTQGTRPMQRRYPWGDTMDRELAHVWDGAGNETTISVFDLPLGVSVGGIYQLIGNVWEWTTSNFGVWDATARCVETSTPMKSIRGGAFDTYFETQAMCQFQSGESPIGRKHNIGFRCALAICDVISTDLDGTTVHYDQQPVPCGSEAQEELV
jgi:iron(II)-dependent oxidoreductase